MKAGKKASVKELELKNYLYFDEQGIDSIYHQLTNEIIVEERIHDTNIGNVKSKIGVGSKIKGLFSAETSFEGEYQTSKLHEKQIAYSYEHKISKIIDITSKLNTYCTDLTKAKEKCLETTSVVLINFSDTFFSRHDFNSYESFEYIQKCGYLEFERGDSPIARETMIEYHTPFDTYTYSDDYYKECRYRVVMSMNLDKMKTSFQSRSSHLVVALRGGNGKINLGVFGQIRNINNLYFQIKPFAVWW